MIVLEIALQVAQNLGKEDLITFLSEGTSADITIAKRERQKIIDCLHNVVLELASGPCKVKVVEEFVPLDKKIYYKDFSNKILSFSNILDKKGSVVKYSVYPTYIALYDDKRVVVEYNCLPNKSDIDQEIVVGNTLITPSILVYGTVAEYYLASSLYDEAVFWRKKYEDALSSVMQNKKFKLKGRIFV
ncbi:MAG: hypothetical protein J6C97_03855 [Clostridia bacterium]|nr:hypothetical protein [Clostridia bacterium]